MNTKFVLDKKNLELKVKYIEKSLEPFINQILLPDPKISASLFKGKSKNANHLIEFLDKSIDNFICKSNEISLEYPEIQMDILNEIKHFKEHGNKLNEASKEFLSDPTSSKKRTSMGNRAKQVLNSVARLLAIIDMIDSYLISKVTEKMQKLLICMKSSKNEEEFLSYFTNYGQNLKDLLNLTFNTLKVISSLF